MLPDTFNRLGIMAKAYGEAMSGNFMRPRQAMEDFTDSIRAQYREQEAANIQMETAAFTERYLTERTYEAATATTYYSDVTDDSRANMEAYQVAMENATTATQNQTLAQLDLAARLADATQAQIAQAAINDLKTALDEGKITFDQYEAAVTETQLAFGIATPQSMALSGGIAGLTEALANGTLGAGNYAEALTKMIAESDRAVIVAGRVREALNGIPRNITVSIDVQERIHGRETGDRRQAGGHTYGGMTLVGEMGPELVSLPRGSFVHKTSDTRSMMSAGRGGIGGGGEMHVHLHMHGGTVVGHAAMRDLALTVGRELEGQKLLAGASRSFEV
jgi:hypothetical protein